ncbi:MAG: hypothetical protein V4547_13440 [Bacteroidota bacterium]
MTIKFTEMNNTGNSPLNLSNYMLIFDESCSGNSYIGGVLQSLLAVLRTNETNHLFLLG